MALPRQQMSVSQFDQFLERPENADHDFEYIGGEIVEVPSNTRSSEIAMTVGVHFKMHLVQHKVNGHITGEAGLYNINGERYAPDVAFKLGAKVSDPVSMYLSDIYTIATNLAGLPGMSIPAGFVNVGGRDMPVGLQLIGNYFDESRLLNVAHQYQQNTDWHTRVPVGFE